MLDLVEKIHNPNVTIMYADEIFMHCETGTKTINFEFEVSIWIYSTFCNANVLPADSELSFVGICLILKV